MPANESESEERRGSIAGAVVRADGTPVADVPVLICEGTAPFPDIAALTDEQGRFRFDDLEPGRYRLLANPERGERRSETVSVEAGRSALLEFRLPW